MLNPGFTAEADNAYGSTFVLPPSLAPAILEANTGFDFGAERRTQRVYGDELWIRLRELGVDDLPWDELDVLDACCGAGFLSYHLLARVRPRSLTLLDVSPDELREAEQLIGGGAPGIASADVSTVCGDLADSGLPGERYDVVIGNSFLHHFHDVPVALKAVHDLARPGGLVIGLHEPTPAAVPLESGRVSHVGAYTALRRWYLRKIRHDGPEPVRAGTADVWLFEARDLRRLLAEQGLVDVQVLPRYLLRPFVIATLRLSLSEQLPRLRPWQARTLAATVRADALLRKILPERSFGGLSYIARRPR
jgi:SAM-dependent methyltransferase